MAETIIKVEGLSKKFCMSLKRSMLYGTYDVAKNMLGIQSKHLRLRKSEFWALEDINFELKRSEIIGLIGKNGSGKTTLLRLINGIFPPDGGRITINGNIGSLISLGAGFHPYMTGRENIYLNGAILGMTKQEIKSKLDEIIDFADIEEFIDSPVATYSSGMTVRLGFAIAIHSQPDILLVDEVLAVGDYNFQYKCFEKIKDLKRKGTGIIFVSHNESSIKAVCTNGILMEHGKIIKIGEINTVLEEYNKLNTKQIKELIINNKNEDKKLTEADFVYRRGNGKVRFSEVYFCDLNNTKIDKVKFGTEKVKIYAKYYAKSRVDNVRVSFSLRDATKGDWVWVYGNNIKNNIIDYLEGEGEFYFDVNIKDMGPNLYGLYIGLADQEITDLAYDVWDINGTVLEIESNHEMVRTGLSVTRPYIVKNAELKHNRL